MPTNLSEFVPRVAIPAVPSPLVIRELRTAARELCRHASGLLRATVTETVNATDQLITLTPPADHSIVAVETAEMDSKKLTRLTKEEIRQVETTTAGTPSYFTNPKRGDVQFERPSGSTFTDGLVCEVAVQPSKTCTAVDDELFEDWEEVIAHGAMAMLYALPKEDWTDLNQAKYHASMFRKGKGKAAIHVLKSKNNGAVTEMKVPRFGGL